LIYLKVRFSYYYSFEVLGAELIANPDRFIFVLPVTIDQANFRVKFDQSGMLERKDDNSA